MKPQPLNLEELWNRILETHARATSKEERKESLMLAGLLDEVRERIKSACEFYWKYKDLRTFLLEVGDKYIEEFKKEFGNVVIYKDIEGRAVDVKDAKIMEIRRWHYEIEKEFYASLALMERWDMWIFKLAFKDISKGGER